ncbi:hypothetical protein [Cognatishimia sp.]|uniref:hypothetical protein n=1 Tax=Cognatishimia sp. TaxID=2211648 RepID=UPI003519C090|nr:hypothetical protein [Cognatishimia sp.]
MLKFLFFNNAQGGVVLPSNSISNSIKPKISDKKPLALKVKEEDIFVTLKNKSPIKIKLLDGDSKADVIQKDYT